MKLLVSLFQVQNETQSFVFKNCKVYRLPRIEMYNNMTIYYLLRGLFFTDSLRFFCRSVIPLRANKITSRS